MTRVNVPQLTSLNYRVVPTVILVMNVPLPWTFQPQVKCQTHLCVIWYHFLIAV